MIVRSAGPPNRPRRGSSGRAVDRRHGETRVADVGDAAGRSLSAEHKQALVSGRAEARAVRRYLEALTASLPDHPSLGDEDPDVISARMRQIDAQLAAAEPALKVRLIRERMDLYARLKALGGQKRLDDLEQDFVAAAGAYSARKGISYDAWRQVGVDESVLERAGIRRAAAPHT